MKLLIITQKVDKEDPVLGFFHNWILELLKKFESISVICLEKGKFDLPNNVEVYSLGKEKKTESRIMNYELSKKIKYANNFLNLILGLHKDYDAVFVHMNQEYVLLGGLFWKIMDRKVYMWRNHNVGNFLTTISVWLSNKVFCTSKFAFVARYKKTEIMPVGINTNQFSINNFQFSNKKGKILFLSRMSPIKKPDLLIDALSILNKKSINFVCDFYGDPTPNRDEEYYEGLKDKVKELGLENKVNFYKAVPNYETPKIYNEYEIFINLTPTGSFDKTILESAVCGCIPIILNKSLQGEIDDKMIIEKETPESVAEKINFWLNLNSVEKELASKKIQKYVLENHSLNALIEKLCITIKKLV
jgi:glycosyltransferase involved in cell wall biosynthesis